MVLLTAIKLDQQRKDLLKSTELTTMRSLLLQHILPLHSLLIVVIVQHLSLFQINVKDAFLSGDLTDKVYMVPPPGYTHVSNKMWRLHRALYGPKHVPHARYSKFSLIMEFLCFTCNPYDHARYTSYGSVMLLLYVEIIVVTGDNHTGITNLECYLSQQFETKDLV